VYPEWVVVQVTDISSIQFCIVDSADTFECDGGRVSKYLDRNRKLSVLDMISEQHYGLQK